jgi:Putative peptidoglycan binding domain
MRWSIKTSSAAADVSPHMPSHVRFAIVALALTLVLAPAGPAGAASSTGGLTAGRLPSLVPQLQRAVCISGVTCGPGRTDVQAGGRLRLSGRRLVNRMVVEFPATPKGRVRARLARTRTGMVVTVPRNARSGRIRVIDVRGRRSNLLGPFRIVKPKPKVPPQALAVPAAGAPAGTAFDGNGMWIWQLGRSSGGDPAAIGAQARAAGVGTVFIKSADGATSFAGQFTPELVQALKAQGLKVCAWQFVYGANPGGEAAVAAQAVQAGADCFVIDAEKDYEGKYAAAQTYIQQLRAAIGPDYPVGMTSFPYVDYHPQLPFSVLLGPGGAQFNLPQMYWKDIGTTVDTVYAHTWAQNRVYGRPILPLGQTYQDPSPDQLVRFRQLAQAYGAAGVSWWDWQETSASEWSTLASPLPPLTDAVPSQDVRVLGKGAKGDQVVWLQQHLATAVPTTPTSGVFDAATDAALRDFQGQRGLPVTGTSDAATWQALLTLAPVAIDWTAAQRR